MDEKWKAIEVPDDSYCMGCDLWGEPYIGDDGDIGECDLNARDEAVECTGRDCSKENVIYKGFEFDE